MRAARTARLFFHTRPIKYLTCGVVVAVPVIYAKAPYFFAGEVGGVAYLNHHPQLLHRVMEKREKGRGFLIAVVIIILLNILFCFPRELLCSVPSPHLLCAMQVLTS